MGSEERREGGEGKRGGVSEEMGNGREKEREGITLMRANLAVEA